MILAICALLVIGGIALGYFLGARKASRPSTDAPVTIATTVSTDIAETTDDSIYILDRACAYLYINSKHLDRLASETSLIGRHYSDIHSRDESAHMQGLVDMVFDSGTSTQDEHLSGSDGKFFLRTLSPVLDSQGKVAAVSVISKDITRLKTVEKELADREMLFRTLFEQAADCILLLTIDPDGTPVVHDANEAACSIYGYKKDELIGMNVSELDDPDAEEDISDRMKALLSGKPLSFEGRYRRKDGTIFPVDVSASLFTMGEKQYIMAIDRDITARKEAEKRLLLLEKAVMTSNAGFNIVGTDFRILLVNPAEAKLHGYEPEELIGEDVAILGAPYEESEKKERGDISSYTSWTRETTNIRKDGSTFQVRLTSDVVRGDEGEAIGLVNICEDITEYKLMEESLNKHRQQLENMVNERTNELVKAMLEAREANLAKSRFLSNVSHEIRTPLTTIIGFTELILASSDMVDIKDKARGVMGESDNLLEIINDILDIARIESGKIRIHREPFSLFDLISKLSYTIEMKARAKGLEFRVEIAESVEDMVIGDRLRLRQVLLNLLHNAIKFSEKGSILLSIERTGEEHECLFKVTDTGIGIDPQKLDLIFKSFTQVDDETSRERGGSGLGLAISKQLVEKMGGKIRVSSIPDKGSTFSFTLSLYEVGFDAQVADTDHIPAEDASIAPMKVLLVEDYTPNQIVVSEHLRSDGHDVMVVSSGIEAITNASYEKYDLILMDLQLPVIDGIEATRRILALDPDTMIIGLTANADSATCQKCVKAGMRNVLSKPVRRQTLRELMSCLARGTEAPRHIFADMSQPGGVPMELDRALAEFDGNMEIVMKASRGFIDAASEQIRTIEPLLSSGDLNEVSREAHKIKGGALNLTAMYLAEAAKSLETSAKNGDRTASKIAFYEMSDALEALTDFMSENGLLE